MMIKRFVDAGKSERIVIACIYYAVIRLVKFKSCRRAIVLISALFENDIIKW